MLNRDRATGPRATTPKKIVQKALIYGVTPSRTSE
jgi:hypothetical protein